MGTAHLRRSRLKGKKGLTRVFEHGKRTHCKAFLLFVYRDSSIQELRVAVCIQKRAGNAVVRNRLKRIARELLDPFCDPSSSHRLPACHLAVLPKPALLQMKHAERKQSLYGCLNKAGLIAPATRSRGAERKKR